MAEVKNTFIQSKMNQDLDARIIPNGQYRTALNVGVSKSEGDDVGALENILGNVLITDFGIDDCSLKCIGHWMDVANDRIFVFITNYSDSSTTLLNNNPAGGASVGTDCYIAYYDIKANKGSIIVGGDWLNFSKTHPIYGVNLIENLLFWTDNRNQPRKINVDTAISNPYVVNSSAGYYFNEDQISVAKYYPFEPISLVDVGHPAREENVFSTMKNVTDKWLPIHCILRVTQPGPIALGKTFITVDGTHTHGTDEENLFGSFAVNEGDRISGPNVKPGGTFTDVQLADVTQELIPPFNTIIRLKNQSTTQQLYEDQNLYVQRKNPDYNPVFSGDPDFLKDKFARFSYRFKFDDGEYSLIAPFTQIAFVPLQDGYFIGDNCEESEYPIPPPGISTNTGPGQESETYRSTIVPFMENKVDEIILRLPAPFPYNTTTTPLNWDQVSNELKITEIDILWKSADDQSIKVIETLKEEFFNNETTNLLDYTYNSTEPWKTLPTNELTRVYDKVPIRALAQEATGNRIIYGNYVDKHTSPGALEYAVNIDEKPPLPSNSAPPQPIDYSNANYVRKEYQNHTLKQNRTYQVGVILSDRYGRQSDVILSNIEAVGGGKASTIYHPYRDINAYLITDQTYATNPSATWPGDMLELSWTNTIPENSTQSGYPGLFSVNDGSVVSIQDIVSSGWGASCGTWKIPFGSSLIPLAGTYASRGSIEFSSNPDGTIDESTIVILPGSYGFNNGQITSTQPSTAMAPCPVTGGQGEATFVVVTPPNNNLGWYSYKIVVKQTEQEYYNCYLPGMLAGYPQDVVGSLVVLADDEPYNVEQEAVNGITYPTGLQRKEAHIVLTNDNINKIPRDLIEVGPDQQQFRSAVKLFGRVENVKLEVNGTMSNLNKQYQPNTLGDTVTVIGPMTELGLGSLTNPEGNLSNKYYAGPADGITDLLIPPHWWDGQSNPLIARVSTKDEIGWRMVPQNAENFPETMTPFLSVYETAPVESKLDIYWETATSGLISELNHLILTSDSKIPVGISDPQLFISEATESGTQVGATFWAEGVAGIDLDAPGDGCTITLVNVSYTGLLPKSVKQKFELVKDGSGYNRYYLKTKTNEFLLSYENPSKCNLIFEFNINRNNGTDPISNTTVTATGVVTNVAPGERIGTTSQSYLHTRQKIKEQAYHNSNIPLPIAKKSGSGCETIWNVQAGGYTNQSYYHKGRMYCAPVGGYDTATSFTPKAGSCVWQPGVAAVAPCPTGTSNPYRCEFGRSERGKGKLYGLRGSEPYQAGSPLPILDPLFDGVFKADNGIYGSQPATLPVGYNGSNQTEDELQFYVARAYQVSAIYGFNVDRDTGRGCPQYGAASLWPDDGLCFPGTPAVEWVFGRPDIAGIVDPTAINWGIPKIWEFGAPLLSGKDVREWIPGPVYLEHSNQSGLTPTDTSGPSFGEAVVGGQYNSGNHYWQDLDLQMQWGAGGSISTWGLTPGGIPYDMMTIHEPKSGNSGPWRLMKRDNSLDLFLTQLGGSANYGQHTWKGEGGTSLFADDFPRFVAKNVGTNNSVQEGEIWVGRGMHGVGLGERNSLETGWTGMPPGRYVVTLRAQDKNGNPDGLFFEWDVPVLILETNDPGTYLDYFKRALTFNASNLNSKAFQCCNCDNSVSQYTSNGGPCNP